MLSTLRFIAKTLRAAITALAGAAEALGGVVAWPLLRIVRHVRAIICLTKKVKIFLRKAGKSHELEKNYTYLIAEDAYVKHTCLAENCFLPRQATG